MLIIYLQGLALGASLIIAIGAQNAFVLSQGIRQEHSLIIPLICSMTDAILIAIGVLGAGAWMASRPLLSAAASTAGACSCCGTAGSTPQRVSPQRAWMIPRGTR